jgi:hypothetical protein
VRGHFRGVPAVLATLLGALLIAGLSRVPYAPGGADGALIRLSWRTPGEYVEQCRKLTPEELEALPIHMRREQVCEGRIVPYRLRMILDGALVYDEIVRAAGAREDRPLYVFRERRVPSGRYDVEVTWEPDRGPEGEGSAAADPGGSAGLRLSAKLELGPGDVSLITYDVNERVLVVRGR